tara:strand:+ start:1193 stop:2356 length:1164 start_codon:yes stop_codon:yes gene_type:complete
MNGYKQTKIAVGDNADFAYLDLIAEGIYEDGVYTYGYWSVRVPVIQFDSNARKIYIDLEFKKTTTSKYPSVNAKFGTDTSTKPEIRPYIQLHQENDTANTISFSDDDTGTTFSQAVIDGLIECKRYRTTGYHGFDLPDNDKWHKERVTLNIDKIAKENTSGQRFDVLSYIDRTGLTLANLNVKIAFEVDPGSSFDFAQLDSDSSAILFIATISDINLEKNKKDYTPRSIRGGYNTLTTEGTTSDYLVWGEPENVKKLQRGNFNVVLGESEIDGLTPDGTFTTHTQMAYSNGAWDLEVSVDGGANWAAFESEVAYTFGASANENFSDTNGIWFHSDVLISDYDDTTITNCNNLYMGDMLFRWGPSELGNAALRKDYYYKIKDNFEDKI